jgi:hypothetical protein
MIHMESISKEAAMSVLALSKTVSMLDRVIDLSDVHEPVTGLLSEMRSSRQELNRLLSSDLY